MRLDLSGTGPCIDLKDPDLGLTASQAEAMDIQSERLVSAGAGSGKTSTLTLRYTALLLDEAWRKAEEGAGAPSVDAALVLTFTDKAAQEMALRCYQRMLEALQVIQGQSDAIREKWGPKRGQRFLINMSALVDQFDNARIGTFHSFCTHLLREFGMQIGLNPSFRLLDEIESQEIAQQACDWAYSAWRAEASTESIRVLSHCFNGRRGLEEALQVLLRNRSKFIDLPETAQVEGHLLQELLEESPCSPEEIRAWMLNEGLPTLRRLEALLSPANGKFFREKLQPLLQSLETLPEDRLKLHQAYRQVLSLLCPEDKLRTLTHSSLLGAKKTWTAIATLEAYNKAKEHLKTCQIDLAHWPGLKLQAEALPTPTDAEADKTVAALAQLLRKATGRLAVLHADARALDFDGLQLECLRLLRSNPDLREALYDRHRFIMVDEFQDTDAIQWEILQHLGKREGQSSQKLFAVGDLKQAIYSFRGGDVVVFGEARQALNKETVLDRNFRSRKEIVSLTNSLFAATMGTHQGTRPSWEAHYSEVSAGRSSKRPGRIGWLSYQRSTARENAATEGALIAKLCAQLLDPQGEYAEEGYGDSTQHPSPPIALLLRRRTHFGAYQSALMAAGIPFRVAKGVGFWQRPEILDLLHGLEAALLGDDIALVGFLRSPLAGVSDPEIQALADGALGPQGLRSFLRENLNSESPQALRLAQSHLRLVREQAAFTSLRRLSELLLKTTTAEHAWALDGDAVNAEANVQKLLNQMGQLEQRGWSHARSLRSFKTQIQDGRRESEADSASTQARVLLQTVHSAKGLEFPVVVLGALQAHQDVSTSLQLGRAGDSWTFACKTPDPTAAIAQRVHNVRSQQINRRRAAERTAEDLRLFYVAITRAEDHLFFVGDPELREKDSWAMHLASLRDQAQEGPKAFEIEHVALEDNPAVAQQIERPQPGDLMPFQAISTSAPALLSPSSLHKHQECPIQWRLQRDFSALSSPTSHVDAIRDAAALRGTILHACLEQRNLDPLHAQQTWSAAARHHPWPKEVLDSQSLRLSEDLQRMAGDESLDQMLCAPSFPEAGFDVPFGNLRIQGRIDLLWKDDDEWVLTDFKSERIDPQTADKMHHREQLTAYAWAASRLLDQPVGRTEVYSTRSACRLPLPPLEASDFDRFEQHLGEIQEDLERPLDELKTRVFSQSTSRPCEDCPYRPTLCPGKATQ